MSYPIYLTKNVNEGFMDLKTKNSLYSQLEEVENNLY